MDRYPHKILIQKMVGEATPYQDAEYATVYEGRGRYFLKSKAAINDGDVSEDTYQIVIPSSKIEDIGENFKVAVKHQHTSSEKEWDLVGFVTNFARYDRVCNVFFQVIKDNQIAEDIP